jgi:hypothetical protein
MSAMAAGWCRRSHRRRRFSFSCTEHIRCICARPDKQVSDVSERETLSRNRRRKQYNFNHGKLTKVPTKQNATAAFMQVCAVLHQFRFYSDHKKGVHACAALRSFFFPEILGFKSSDINRINGVMMFISNTSIQHSMHDACSLYLKKENLHALFTFILLSCYTTKFVTSLMFLSKLNP